MHGLIVATSNIESNTWYNGVNFDTVLSSTAIGSGLVNTIAIITNQG